jgi:hypothetical protein
MRIAALIIISSLAVPFLSAEAPVHKESPPDADGVYTILEPRRTLKDIDATYSLMPHAQWKPPADRWNNLSATKKRLEEGRDFHIVMLGDSIVNDTARSAWVLLLAKEYPKCKVRMTTVVRGSTGCWWYKSNGRFGKYVVPLKPDLLVIGGISQRGEIASIREVIELTQALTHAEVLVTTGVFGELDPTNPRIMATSQYSGLARYGADLKSLASQMKTGYLDMTRPWADYVKESGKDLTYFKRDRVHANEQGEQVLGRILATFLAPGGVNQ